MSDYRGFRYATFAQNLTDAVLGNGRQGDHLHRIIVAGGTATLKDGAVTIGSFAAGNHELNMRSVTKWTFTTGTGVTVIAIGDFTA
jgi:hypothetical protein